MTTINQHGAHIGHILTAVWGYDDTIITTYKVIKTTAKTITVQNTQTGKIHANKHTKCYYKDDRRYGINIGHSQFAEFNPADPHGTQARQWQKESDHYKTICGR